MKKGTVFFDYDGTLHNSMLTYGPAFREVYADLVKNGTIPNALKSLLIEGIRV